MYSGNVIHTNVRSLYSTTGFPHWMIPYVPSLLRGDQYCLTGSILESQYLRDGAGYNNSSGNLWIKLLNQCGVTALPLSCHSEFTNAFIVAKSGNAEQIAEIASMNGVVGTRHSEKRYFYGLLMSVMNL